MMPVLTSPCLLPPPCPLPLPFSLAPAPVPPFPCLCPYSFNPFTGFMNATYILKAPRDKGLLQQAVVAVLGVSGGKQEGGLGEKRRQARGGIWGELGGKQKGV
jgi:hypothetical protein